MDLIEKVLINLLMNGIQVLENRADQRLQMKAFLNAQGRVVIQVVDNGPGIVLEIPDRIFIPFL